MDEEMMKLLDDIAFEMIVSMVEKKCGPVLTGSDICKEYHNAPPEKHDECPGMLNCFKVASIDFLSKAPLPDEFRSGIYDKILAASTMEEIDALDKEVVDEYSRAWPLI